jgi:hypothetical protein
MKIPLLQRRRTFDSITAGLQTTITQLEELTTSNIDKAADVFQTIDLLQQQIATKHAEANALAAESSRATVTAAKIRALLS